MAEYLSPGVYVEEFNSGAAPVQGVGTSTAGFIGAAQKGPGFGPPVLVTNFATFTRAFGGYLSEDSFGEYRYLAYAVNQFFINGGTRCYVKRVVPPDAAYAHNTKDKSAPFTVYAKEPGAFGNLITLTLTPGSKARTQALEAVKTESGVKYRLKNPSGFLAGDIVTYSGGGTVIHNRIKSIDGGFVKFENEFEEDITDTGILPSKVLSTCEVDIEIRYDVSAEKYTGLSLNASAHNFINGALVKSELVVADAKVPDEIIPPYEFLATAGADGSGITIGLSGGSDGTAESLSDEDFIGFDKGPSNRSGIQAFIDNNEVSVIAAPGIVSPSVLLTLVAHCENMASRFAVLDIPKDSKAAADVLEYRNMFDSSYAAAYHPWLKVYDPLTKNNISVPPSGSVMGIYARSDTQRGVHKAPANEVVSACAGLECNYTSGEQDILNPKGVNLIRAFSGQGIRIWGARTLSSDPLWRYVNVRRLFIFIEESIKQNTNWVVFEPNDEVLWLRVRRTIEIFLGDLWRAGALFGSNESEAFFVNIGTSTMTQGDIDNGRLICVIGVAPVKPAEFVIFRITQHTSGGN